MKVIYVAGKFTGQTHWDIEQNVRRAEEVSLEIAKLGAMPLCPHTNTRFFHGQCTPEFWYEGTLELLKRSDAIYLCEGWENSKGSQAEYALARKSHMPIFNSLREVSSYINLKLGE